MMKTHHRILKNFLSLSAAEVVRKGLAFFTYAILARVLNPAGFGDFNWAMTFVMYFLLFVDMGFNLIGIREVARDHSIIKKYVNHIITIRSIISILCFAIMVMIAVVIDRPMDVKIMVIISGINLFANALLLDWVFQGIEKMEILAVRQIIVGALNLVGVVIFVNSADDKIAAMLVFMLSLLINSIWLLGYYIKTFGMVKFSYNKELWKKIFEAAIPMGVSNLFIMVITGTSIMLLGFMSTSDETGYFAAAHKVFMISLLPLTIIQGTMFPIISRAKTLEARQSLLNKYTTLVYFVGAIICFSIMAYSDHVIAIIYGPKYDSAPIILQILMINSLLIHFNNSYSAPLIAWNHEKEVLKVTIVGAAINVMMNLYLIPIYGAYGSAWANFAGEVSILVFISYIVFKKIRKIFIFNYIRFIIICGLGILGGWLIYIYFNIHFSITVIISIIAIISTVFVSGIISIKDLRDYFIKSD
jgi:O-antigen/teichoic acid export membrane protein